MIDCIKKKLIKANDYLKDEIEDIGGIKIFMIALIVTIVAIPFMILYYLLKFRK